MKQIDLKWFLVFLILILSFSYTNAQENDNSYAHLIMYGQSLSTGHESTITLSGENVPGNYMIGNQIWINYGNNIKTILRPLSGSVSKETKDIVECPLLGAANHIRLKMPEAAKIIATSAGISGTSIEELSKQHLGTGARYAETYFETLKAGARLARNENASIACPAIFWLQGEWNYQGHGTGMTSGSKPVFEKDEYKKLMIALKEDMQQDAMNQYKQTEPPLFITYQVGAQYTKGKKLTIGMAQLEAANEHKDIVCAGPVYPMTDVGGHLDANGYRWYGEMLGKVYYKTKILKEDFSPLQPKKIWRDETDDKKLIIQYHVPKLPLVWDINTLDSVADYGFKVYSKDFPHLFVPREITNMEIVGDCVVITVRHSMELSKNIEIVYAGEKTSGNGNLRDSDDYQAFFNYQDLDEKDGEGRFIYPRAEARSLRPAYEPKDNSGNIIYGKPYPLYNFSLAFYYEIPANTQSIDINLHNTTGESRNSIEDNISIEHAGSSLFVKSAYTNHIQVCMYDYAGRLVADFGQTNAPVAEYSLSRLPEGFYIVRAMNGNQLKTEKIFVRNFNHI